MKRSSALQPNTTLPSAADLHLPVRRRNRRTRLSDVLGSTSMRIYGAFFLTFGAFTVFSQLFKYLIDAETTEANVVQPLICGFALVIFSIPFFISDKPLWKLAIDVRLFRFISFDYFCLPHSSLHTAKGIPLLLSIAIGFLFSAFGFFVSPLISVMTLLGLLILSCAVSAPEMPLFLSILFFPVLLLFPHGPHILCMLILICLFAYLRKLFSGRRKADFSLYDPWLILFGVFVLLSGIFSGSKDSLVSSVLLCCYILAFPLVENLLTNPRLLTCAFGSFTVGSFLASILAVLRALLDGLPDFDGFGNPVVRRAAELLYDAVDTRSFTVYLICTVFASLFFMQEKTSRSFFWCQVFSLLFAVAALSFSLDFLAIFAIVAAVLTVRIFASPKKGATMLLFPVILSVPALLIVPHTIPVIGELLEDTVLDFDVRSLGSLLPVLRRCAIFGTGPVTSAAESLFEDLTQDLRFDSLFFTLLTQAGVVAFAIFFLTLSFRPFQLGKFRKNYGYGTRNYAAFCASAAAFAIVVLGVFRYPFSDLCNFCPFFTVFAIGSVALTNYERDVKNRLEASRQQSEANEATAYVLIRKH